MADAPMKPLQVGLLGMGTVGRGTWDVLRRNEEEITRRAGRPIRIEWIAGIVNGTSNFILSEMRATGASFARALADAQARGYAEADPSFDVEGIDSAHKLTIMSAIAFGVPMQFDKAYTEGISQLH